MSVDVMLQEAIDAVRQGQRLRAKDLLARIFQTERGNPQAWLWMSAVVDSPKEYIYCLQKALQLDPDNQAARQGLILAGALEADERIKPLAPVRRAWEVAVNPEPASGLPALWAKPVVRWSVFSLAAVLVTSLILLGIFWPGRANQTALRRSTRTPGSAPTYTPTPTYVGKVADGRTIVPTTPGVVPLWMLLEATYTPTPRYVNTPHAISEAYRIAQRADDRQDWGTALQYYQQASEVDPGAADLQYLVGETLMRLERFPEALAAYEQALERDPSFGPAYYGRAHARWEIDRSADVLDDLDLALQHDPNLAEAYLERAAIQLALGDFEQAEADLAAAEKLLPDTPWVPHYRAQIFLAQGIPAQAYRQAQLAYNRDRTMLPVYLSLAQSAVLTGRFTAAQQAAEVYVQQLPSDPAGWLVMGEVAYRLGDDLEAGLEALEHALQLDDNLAAAHLYRALIFIDLEEGQQAVNELVVARRVEPRSFAIHLAMGRALMAAGRTADGYATLDSSVARAETDSELAQALYWRALAAESMGSWRTALTDWQALLELPVRVVGREWQRTAEEHVATLAPTATPATDTPSPTATLTPGRRTPTVRPAITATKTVTVIPTTVTPTALKTTPVEPTATSGAKPTATVTRTP